MIIHNKHVLQDFNIDLFKSKPPDWPVFYGPLSSLFIIFLFAVLYCMYCFNLRLLITYVVSLHFFFKYFFFLYIYILACIKFKKSFIGIKIEPLLRSIKIGLMSTQAKKNVIATTCLSSFVNVYITLLYFFSSEVGTVFSLSWLITWFGHVLDDIRHIVRLYDFFIANHGLMPIYLAAAVSS